MIRAFIGVRIDPEMVQRICQVLSQLKGGLKGIRWVRDENFHFTLKFLGPVQEEKISRVAEALARISSAFSPFIVSGRGIGVFPDIRKARVLWVGLKGGELGRLASEVEKALEPMGFAPESRPFRPHLTVGRWRHFDGRPEKLKMEIEPWKDYDFGETRVEEMVFFQSILKPEGAVYSPLKVMALGDQATRD